MAGLFEFSIDVQVSVEAVIKTARDAGDAILEVYNNTDKESWEVEAKSDKSPLTLADRRANAVICAALSEIAPHIPIVSEENKLVPYSTRKQYKYFWCVDPLDGTKEFIKRNGQFTVNIALIKGNRPVLGVVHTPCQGRMHWAVVGRGAYLRSGDNADVLLRAAEFNDADEGLTVVGSASHSSKETEDFVAQYKSPKFVALGSSLKLLLVAEGAAHVYPRLGLTSEWDTAASQIIVEEAGGEVLEHPALTPLLYGKGNPLNSHFIVYGNRRKGTGAA